MRVLTCTLLLLALVVTEGVKFTHTNTRTKWWLDVLSQAAAKIQESKPNRTSDVTRAPTPKTRPPTSKPEVTTQQIYNIYRQVDSKRLRQKQTQKTRKPPTTTTQSKPNFEIYYPDDLRHLQAKELTSTAKPYSGTKKHKSKFSTTAHSFVATTTPPRFQNGRTTTAKVPILRTAANGHTSIKPTTTPSLQRQTEASITLSSTAKSNSKCHCGCWPVSHVPKDSSTLESSVADLNAEALFTLVSLTKDNIPSVLGVQGPYTFFLPTNDAFCRLTLQIIDKWRQDKEALRQALRNHVVIGRMPLDELQKGGVLGSNLPNGNLRVNNNDNETLTVNGGRIVYSDIPAPLNGVVHLVDAVLHPIADRNLLQTIQDCKKFDGFLSLLKAAELLDILTDEGPFTIFLPTNDALSKMEKGEYSVFKTNKTALREFLLYHMVYGAYFSSDLIDGHYLETGRQGSPIRVSIRVDGCHRRLVEVNSSPLHRTDIPASNGVVHILDWVLLPSDIEWCESATSL